MARYASPRHASTRGSPSHRSLDKSSSCEVIQVLEVGSYVRAWRRLRADDGQTGSYVISLPSRAPLATIEKLNRKLVAQRGTSGHRATPARLTPRHLAPKMTKRAISREKTRKYPHATRPQPAQRRRSGRSPRPARKPRAHPA